MSNDSDSKLDEEALVQLINLPDRSEARARCNRVGCSNRGEHRPTLIIRGDTPNLRTLHVVGSWLACATHEDEMGRALLAHYTRTPDLWWRLARAHHQATGEAPVLELTGLAWLKDSDPACLQHDMLIQRIREGKE